MSDIEYMNDEFKQFGGPAFPVATGPMNNTQFGMSLRDWYAGLALGSVMNSVNMNDLTSNMEEYAATRSYLIADEMLKARSR